MRFQLKPLSASMDSLTKMDIGYLLGSGRKAGDPCSRCSPHELEQTAGHQRGTQHRGNDLVQDLDRAAAINGGRLVQVMGMLRMNCTS